MNLIKEFASGKEVKDSLIAGAEKAKNIVGSTMGYRGKTVLIESDGGLPAYTKDGHDTLMSMFFADPIENLSLLTIKEAVRKTVDFAGDGTSATVVLAHAFIKYSHEQLDLGKKPNEIVKNIEESRDKVIAFLKEISVPVTDKLIYDVAYTSSNSDETLAKIVSEAFIQAGENGSVGHFRSNSDETYYEFIDGSLFESGFTDELFINNHSDRTVVLNENPFVICSEIKFNTFNQIKPFLEYALEHKRQLVIVSDMDFEVRNVILSNVLNNTLQAVVIYPPKVGQQRREALADLALLCNGNAITTLSGEAFSGRAAEFIGTSESVIVGKSDSIFIKSKNAIQEKIDSKISELKDNITKTEFRNETDHLNSRISKLSSKACLIKVGGITEAELQEKIARVDDAVCAVRSAREEGVVAGGGIALYNASESLDLDFVTYSSITAPLTQILTNASFDSEEIAKLNIGEYPTGYDVKTFSECNMIEKGIVDATKVVRNALINAVAVSNTILMTDNAITNKRQKNE